MIFVLGAALNLPRKIDSLLPRVPAHEATRNQSRRMRGVVNRTLMPASLAGCPSR